MTVRRGNLQPAHQGYRYQDIATAYVLVRSVVERYDEVIVDRKQVDDDRIDDLEVRAAGRRVRRQFKSSQNATRPLAQDDFTASGSSLRIDRLVLTHVRAGTAPADEYRLCATWAPPLANDPLTVLLEPVTTTPTLSAWPAQCFRLRGNAIWPASGSPIWAPLANYAIPGAEFGRAEVLEFCERFIIELALPVASTELTAPGPLERALVEELADRVGIGRYPNHGRDPDDAAALAIALACIARTQEASLTPADVERELKIRVDFGRVAQSFPLDTALFHDRPTFRYRLRQAALAGAHQLVVAPPGAGKSWELTRLADELRAAGALVAQHYCYLEPGDNLVERRVTTDVFFGNLLGELLDAEPALHGAGGARYAAGIAELEAALTQAAASGRPVALIVDGLDHISRVRADARGLGDDETDIVEQLATLDVPQGVALVIGSQPGPHLDPLRSRWGDALAMRLVPPWLPPDLEALADRHGVARALATVGVTNEDDIARIRSTLADRADGSPLYARYLSRWLVAGLQDGTIASPDDWIAEAPAIAGDVAVYYAHLYRTASAQAQAIADVLGVIDFAVTEGDLREMLPAFVGAWVPAAFARLAPVLTAATGQGGVRVFHESFRRFMTQELVRQGRSPADALAPVIEWLAMRGFYKDAKAYRFLLPALRRAGRGAEVLARVNVTFVSDSVAQAHPLDAVQRNLALAADVAAQLRDWPALVRCVELHRAAYTCFEDGQNDWRDYWATYLALFGPTALAERLLFDGRPTVSRSDGLYACALVDDAGGTPPWREYLDVFKADTSDTEASADMFDRDGSLTPGESELLAVVHGRLRLGGYARIVRWLLAHLRECGDKFKPLFVRRLAARLARMAGAEFVERIARRADPARRGGARMTRRAASVLRLGVADEHARAGAQSAAADAAARAVESADTPELAAACLSHGARPNTTFLVPAPATLPIAVGPDEFFDDANGVRAWVASVRLHAADRARGQSTLDAEVQRINGPGWYRCWLRFVLALARADAAQRAGDAADVGHAFAELTRDVHPFRGKPRACDLSVIRQVICETVAWGLSLVRTEAEWRDALDALATASKGTATRLDKEDGGPLPTGMLLEVLLPYVEAPVGGALVRDAVEQQMARLEAVGTYYPTHADYAMRLARARHAVGDVAGAREAWAQGAVFRAAYGWHKDVTVFDILESAPALFPVSQDAALRALADAQPLANAVVAHTDHRETRHAPNEWLHGLLKVHPAAGIAVLARTMTEEDNPDNWINVQAMQDVADEASGVGDPALIDALLATLRFKVEYQEDAVKMADARLAPILRLLTTDRLHAEQCLRLVAAAVSGDGRRHTEGAAARVTAIATEHGIALPRIAPLGEQQPSPERRDRVRPWLGDTFRLPGIRVPPFAPNPTLVDILTGLRAACATRRRDDVGAWDDVVLALGYHLGQLVDEGREDDARRLLRFFARDTNVATSSREHPLGKLAAALDAAGYARLAAVAYALAYTATRGDGWWRHMGGKAHGYLIERAIALDPLSSRQVVADEVSYALRGSWYSSGISLHLVERLAAWGEHNAAEAAWREAFSVVQHRLPLAPDDGWFARLRDEKEPTWPDLTWSVDESLVALLLARLGDPLLARKVSALSGVVHAIERRPDAVATPMRWWLTRNAHITSVLLALNALASAETAPYPITNALHDVLYEYTACDLWGVRQLAADLLARAGRPISGVQWGDCGNRDNEAGNEPEPARRRELLSVDVSGVIEDLALTWPDLPKLVARRLHGFFSADWHLKRVKSRYQLAYGPDGRSIPPTPILPWETELFEVALHDALCGLVRQSWATGQWIPGMEDALIQRVLPNARLHLGLAASRAPRPAWPPAGVVTDGVDTIPTLGDDDPTYAGWARLALVEHQYVTDPQRPHSAPVESVMVLAGTVAAPIGASIPPDASPFREGSIDGWWEPDAPPVTFPLRMPLGPLVYLDRAQDWLGNALVLTPPPEFHRYFALEAPRYGRPLIWADSTGTAALALRTWRVLNKEAISAEPVACEGADLVVRPDLFERLRQLYWVPLRELRVVWRRPITRPSD